ncbi:MAG: serine/threonine protein kinase [Planctomycetes bacterium]|nr:serine/threonine protein kinase [Planctomycetota bacterium]
MGTPIPPRDIKLAQLAVQLRYVTAEQVRSSLELYRRYQSTGGEVPSIPRILVGKGFMSRAQAEILLRHMIAGEPIGQTVAAAAPVQAPASAPRLAVMPASAAQPAVEEPAEPPMEDAPAPIDEGDEREMLLKGLGATVLRGEIKGYKILEVIGEGSMGVVYRAHQISMDRIVALKVLPPERTKDTEFVRQFLDEARNAGRLNHPNLIRVHEVGQYKGLYYYSMEYVDGLTLGEMMDEFEGGRLESKRAVNIFAQVAAALDHGYRSGIIHREIRPDTIWITEGDQAKLDGLGLTKDESARFLEGENAYYVSPEQVKGIDADTRSDIYSLGCCMYHCLTGEPPFQGGGPKEILGRRLLAEPPDPAADNTDVPRELALVGMRMMARDIQQRFQTPGEVMDALKKIVFGSPTGAQKPTTKSGAPVRGTMRRRLRGRPGAGGAGGVRRRRFRR